MYTLYTSLNFTEFLIIDFVNINIIVITRVIIMINDYVRLTLLLAVEERDNLLLA